LIDFANCLSSFRHPEKDRKEKLHMTISTQWQLAHETAERYQTILTPAILGPFAKAIVDFAALRGSEKVVDAGCGTGAAARYAAEVVGADGNVIGIDKNRSMIAIAKSLPAVQGSPIEWREADVAQLPLVESCIDVVLCAQMLQFVQEKQASLSEMRRVLCVNGRVVLSLWCHIAENPYFEVLVSAVDRYIGSETAVGLQSAFSLTDENVVYGLLQDAGFSQIEMNVTQLDLPFSDLAEFVPRHISATPMIAGFERASENVQQTVIQEVVDAMSQYRANGRYQIPFKSHMIMGKK
jgi:ubiquinone/menaquinone biosynthesis C-methylase UbiE